MPKVVTLPPSPPRSPPRRLYADVPALTSALPPIRSAADAWTQTLRQRTELVAKRRAAVWTALCNRIDHEVWKGKSVMKLLETGHVYLAEGDWRHLMWALSEAGYEVRKSIAVAKEWTIQWGPPGDAEDTK